MLFILKSSWAFILCWSHARLPTWQWRPLIIHQTEKKPLQHALLQCKHQLEENRNMKRFHIWHGLVGQSPSGLSATTVRSYLQESKDVLLKLRELLTYITVLCEFARCQHCDRLFFETLLANYSTSHRPVQSITKFGQLKTDTDGQWWQTHWES